jgi:hypothetical protein
MAACFSEWTVLPHRSMEKLAPNLWSVEGTMPGGSLRRMTVARLRDGRLVVHNAIALDRERMAELDAFGEVAAILVPNGWHRQDARIWKDRYPKAKVYCPTKTTRKVAQVVAVDGSYETAPQDDTVEITHLRGVREAEGFVRVQAPAGNTVIFNDVILNMPKTGGPIGFMIAPTGRPSIPRMMRWMTVKDRRALGAHLSELAGDTSLERIVVGHGNTIEAAAGETLRSLVGEFCA